MGGRAYTRHMADETAPTTDPTGHAYNLAQDEDGWHWECTCGAAGKSMKTEAATYDAWIKHQQGTFKD